MFCEKTLTAASASRCSTISLRSHQCTWLLVVLFLYLPSNKPNVKAIFFCDNHERNHQKKILGEIESIESIERKLWMVEQDIIPISQISKT